MCVHSRASYRQQTIDGASVPYPAPPVLLLLIAAIAEAVGSLFLPFVAVERLQNVRRRAFGAGLRSKWAPRDATKFIGSVIDCQGRRRVMDCPADAIDARQTIGSVPRASANRSVMTLAMQMSARVLHLKMSIQKKRRFPREKL